MGSTSITETGSLYSRPVGFIFVFNLIVGAGVLAMPKAFGDAGWLAGTIFLVVLGFFSFVTSTFMVEVMAAGNAWLRVGNQQPGDESEDINAHPLNASVLSDGDDDSEADNKESDALLGQWNLQDKGREVFKMTDRIEMGQLANFFFSRVGIVLYYLCIVVYLYGDLSIYAVAIPKAFAAVVCKNSTYSSSASSNSTNLTLLYTYATPTNMSSGNATNLTKLSLEECFGSNTITKKEAYYVFLGAFTILLGPFVFFNVQKTKYLQITTSITRYIALGMMVGIALDGIINHGHRYTPPVFNITQIPNLFGALVYAFMCQHSLPSMITPISKKRGLTVLLGFDFIAAALFYALITFTAINRFDHKDIDDEYSNNFSPDVAPAVPSYYIRLFPVFTLSTSFPIIGVTLRNNLKLLFHREGREFPFVIDRIVFPLAALIPPVALAFVTENLELLVGITGSYAGVGVQYVIPAMLVWCARHKMKNVVYYNNPHQSVFGSDKWVCIVCFWAIASWIMVTVNNIVSHV